MFGSMRPVLYLLALSLGALPAYGQVADSGAFVTQLGKDTIAIERFVRSRDSVWGEVVTRAPKTARSRYVAHLDRAGNVATYELVTGSGKHVTATVKNDTVHAGTEIVSLTLGGPANRYAVPLAEPTY